MSRHLNPLFLRMRFEKRPLAEIAAALGVAKSTVQDYVTDFNKRGFISPVYKHGGRKSPPGRVELLTELWLAGMHVEDVAKRLGTTRAAVEGLVAYHGIKRDRPVFKAYKWTPERIAQLRQLREANKTDEEIGQVMGMAAKTINRARRKFANDKGKPDYVPYKAWSDEEAAELVRLWTVLKLNPAEIARRMGRTRNQIESKSLRLRLPRNVALKIIKKPAARSYDTVAASNRARFGTTMKPRPKAGPKEDSNVIPLTARPWLTRERGECVYPYGARGNVYSCCQPVWGENNMCEAHFAACHDFSRSKRVAA